MMDFSQKSLIIGMLILIAILLIYTEEEKFTTRRDKAKTITEWFNKTDKPSYTKFKSQVPGANIVDYEKASTLRNQGQLSTSTMM